MVSEKLLTAVIIPTYNEKENIENLVRTIEPLDFRKIIIVVDDNSPDGTGAIADDLAKALRSVVVIHRASKLGLGTAYIAGFRKGLALGANRFVTMDADFSHNPKYIPHLIEKTLSVDVAIGSRYINGGGTVNFGVHRQFLSKTANFVAKRALRLSPGDCTSGFRCYASHVLEKLDPATIESDGYSYLVEFLFRCVQAGFTIGEIPIIFVNRAEGKSKISRTEIFKAMNTVWRLYRNRNNFSSE